MKILFSFLVQPPSRFLYQEVKKSMAPSSQAEETFQKIREREAAGETIQGTLFELGNAVEQQEQEFPKTESGWRKRWETQGSFAVTSYLKEFVDKDWAGNLLLDMLNSPNKEERESVWEDLVSQIPLFEGKPCEEAVILKLAQMEEKGFSFDAESRVYEYFPRFREQSWAKELAQIVAKKFPACLLRHPEFLDELDWMEEVMVPLVEEDLDRAQRYLSEYNFVRINGSEKSIDGWRDIYEYIKLLKNAAKKNNVFAQYVIWAKLKKYIPLFLNRDRQYEKGKEEWIEDQRKKKGGWENWRQDLLHTGAFNYPGYDGRLPTDILDELQNARTEFEQQKKEHQERKSKDRSRLYD